MNQYIYITYINLLYILNYLIFTRNSCRYRYGGTEVTTLVLHIFGEIDAMRKDLMMARWGRGDVRLSSPQDLGL